MDDSYMFKLFVHFVVLYGPLMNLYFIAKIVKNLNEISRKKRGDFQKRATKNEIPLRPTQQVVCCIYLLASIHQSRAPRGSFV